METAFCENCRENRPYIVSMEQAEATVRGTTFRYVREEATCSVCGAELYVPAINDANVDAREAAYSKAMLGI